VEAYATTSTIFGVWSLLKTLLADELGTFANGKPAIAIEPPQVPKAGIGLHVTIARYTQQLTTVIEQWQIVLVQRDRSAEGIGKLDSAIAKMRKTFPLAREVFLPYQEGFNFQVNYLIPAYKTFTATVLPTHI
jgi:hypothetical protein